MTGSITISADFETPSGETLVIGSTGSLTYDSAVWSIFDSGSTLIVDAGGTVTIDNTANTAIVMNGILNNYGTITIYTNGYYSIGILEGTMNNYGTINLRSMQLSGQRDIEGTFTNFGTVNFEDAACVSGCEMEGAISGPAFSLVIETRTSSGAPISTSVTVSGPSAPSSPVTTNSSGDYVFPSGTLTNGATYSVSATINGAPLSASVVLGGNSVVVLEPTPSSPLTGIPEFQAFMGAVATAAIAFLLVTLVRTRRNRQA